MVTVVASNLMLMAQDPVALRKQRDELSKRGMHRDAFDFYKEKLLTISDEQSGVDLKMAVATIYSQGNWRDFDALVEGAVATHTSNVKLLVVAASSYQGIIHSGRLIAGDFERGQQADAASSWVNTAYRDRVRSLQLLGAALAGSKNEDERDLIWWAFPEYSQYEAWKLQTLTPLETLPEWGETGPEGATEGAPWGESGPVLYEVPKSWEAAKNDGERWRFALAEKVRFRPELKTAVTLGRAIFSRSQFGTETLASDSGWNEFEPDQAKEILELETLAEDECLAQTSAGIRRFKLPADQHFIALYRSIVEESERAGDLLVEVFLNRRQYVKAREVLEQTLAKFGPGEHGSRQKLLKQIGGNWGRFEPAATVAAGVKPKLPLVFRNASKIKLTAARVDMEAVFRDTLDFLKSKPAELDEQRLNPSQIASRLIQDQPSRFISPVSVTWESRLTPRDSYRNTRVEIEAPLDRAGAWWVSGEMETGNLFHTLVWVVDSVLVQNDVGGNKQYWVADAASGAPLPESEIEFIGYRVEFQERKTSRGRRFEIDTKNFRRRTDGDGKTLLKPGDYDENFQWLAIARHSNHAAAFLGFQPYQTQLPQLENGNRDLTYAISDRPLYQPGDTAHLKFFLRNVGYSEPDEHKWANQIGKLVLTNGRGEEVLKLESLKTDALGALASEVILPKQAGLGNWTATFQINDQIRAAIQFRVEEFRKPEYEVQVEAPAEPVKFGDKFVATVKATYFHGSPVRNADVEITVKRNSIDQRWFPVGRWDWLYGSGGWWNGSEASWHPTWKTWGCIAPHPPWWQQNRWTPEELVLKRNLPIGPDGRVQIEIDTAAAKLVHGDLDSKYTLEARVVDASRREQRATGSVIAARKAFEVVVWTDHGYTRAGEQIEATVAVATLAAKPVSHAQGTLTLLKLSPGENGRIDEKPVLTLPVETDSQGEIHQRFAAPATGQYRLLASLALAGGDSVSGATILNVLGPGRAEPSAWHFGPLEIIAEKLTYAPGETLKLRINSDHENAQVWLFLHLAGSTSREACRIQLDGKSLEVELPLDLRDMPNMFVEAVSVFDGQVHSALKQILLPPVSKRIEVTLEPAKRQVKPRETTALRITLRDAAGKPITGTAVLSIYDKSLEAIAGGSNVTPILANFWSWKNSYNPNSMNDSVPRSPGNLLRSQAIAMQSLGRFDDPEHSLKMDLGNIRRGRGGVGSSAPEPFSGLARRMAKESSVMAADSSASQAVPHSEPIVVRKDFADLLKWSGSIQTDAEGHAEIPLEFPDNLTTWKAHVWVLGNGTQVGEGTAEIISSKDLLVRLQAPRFLVERDESVFSAIVQNDHDQAKTVKVSLELDGDHLVAIDGAAQTVVIAARSEARVDWRVKACHEGEATFRMRADSGDDGDAVERKLPIRIHGMSRQDAWSRTIEPGASSAKITIEVPELRRIESSKLSVQFSPSIAGAVVDAIPYLASYPYGCTEQTLNRFVPAVIAQQMLKQLKINLAEVKAKRSKLNPQELGNPAVRAAQWQQWQTNPVFDEAEIAKMVAQGSERILAMQNADGGWGWFSGYREISYPHTTAVVVHGLGIAKANGAKIPQNCLDSGIAWLSAYERKQIVALQLHTEREALRKQAKTIKPSNEYEKSSCDALDAFVRLVLGEAKRDSESMLEFLDRSRRDLPVYAKCLLALEFHRKGKIAQRDEVMQLISQFLKRDAENQTAYLDLNSHNFWWNWYGSEVEANAWYLKLLAAVKPQDPDARGLAKYLVNHRKHANYWESTRDTAFAIEAIATYFKASGEDAPEMEVEVMLDGKSLRKIAITRENFFSFDGTVTLTGPAVTTGKHELELKKSGTGSLYANAYLEVFSLEDKLRAAGLEVKVTRHFSKLIALEKENEVPDANGVIAKQQVERFRREPLADGAKLNSGDRVEVELVLESKNDYEYLIFSDAKAAGLETLDTLSGYVGSGGLNAYMEPHDQTVDFFIRALPRGTSTLRYQLRAEAPGVYQALPAVAEAMYAPELRGNSAGLKLEVASPSKNPNSDH